jgi:hypothetical protein
MRKSANWESEFGKEYDIPKEVLSLVSNGLAKDFSWHNDISPSFGYYDDIDKIGIVDIRLWVGHPDPWLREYEDMPRFLVTHDNEDYGTRQPVVETGDVDVAVRTYLDLLKSLKKEEPAKTDPKERLWDLYHKGGERSMEESAEYSDLLRTLGRKPYMARVDKENKKS